MKSAGCDRNKFNVSFMMSSMRNQWLCAYHTFAISFPYHFTSISFSLCSTSSSRWLSLLLQPKQIIMDASINFFFSISAEQCLACNRSKINISKKVKEIKWRFFDFSWNSRGSLFRSLQKLVKKSREQIRRRDDKEVLLIQRKERELEKAIRDQHLVSLRKAD